MRISLNWGTGIALVYSVFALATTGFVTFAMSRPVDLVSSDYYEQSLRLDQRMEAERNAAALNPAPSVDVSSARALTLSLPGAQAASATGTVTLYRPSDARADRARPLHLDHRGQQVVPLEGLTAGQWIVKLQWSADGRNYYYESPIVVP